MPFQVDSSGNRIKTDILSTGYIRQEIEKNGKLLIPAEIKQICFDYWFIHVCDEWDKQYSNDKYEINGSCIKLKGEEGRKSSAYGKHVVESGIYSWEIKIKSPLIHWVCIGVIQDDDKLLKKHRNNSDYENYDYGGCLFRNGAWYSHGRSRTGYGPGFGGQNDVVEMILDMNNHTISYKVNDEDYGIACNKMNKDKYRLVINFDDVDDEIELL